MGLRKLKRSPTKPRISASRSNKINKFYKSKYRYNAQGFVEIYVAITLTNGVTMNEYGYSQEFNVGNAFEYRSAIEDAYLNALAKVLYRNGYMFSETDELDEVDTDDVTEIDIIDYNIYYLSFKGETLSLNMKSELVLYKDGVPRDNYGQDIKDKNIAEIVADRESTFNRMRGQEDINTPRRFK